MLIPACILLFVTRSFAADELPTSCGQLNDEVRTLKYDDGEDFIFTCNQEYGYKFLLTVEDVDIDYESENYLLIKPGDSLQAEGSGLVFTFTMKKKSFVIPTNSFYLLMKVKQKTAKPNKFTLRYQRIGQNVITTTEDPSATTLWPEAKPDEKIHTTIYVGGRRTEDYNKKKTQDEFKDAIVDMAVEYCEVNNIELNLKPTKANVALDELKPCPYNWPNTEECVEIRLAVPVSPKNVSRGYELEAGHLEVMWDRYEGILASHGFSRYRLPEYAETMVGWIVMITLVIIMMFVVIGIVVAINYYNIKRYMARKRKTSDATNINRESFGSDMYPDSLQSVPDIFEDVEPRKSYPYANKEHYNYLSDESESST